MAGLTMPRVTVEMAIGSNPLDSSPTWRDVTNVATPSAGLLSCRTHRGRSHELAQMQPGTCTMRYRNVNDWWNPFNTASPYYGNLLSANQADLETDTTGWNALSTCTLSRSTTQAFHGSASLKMTATGSGDMVAITSTGTSGVVVYPGQVYCASALMRAVSLVNFCRIGISWYDSGGSPISSAESTDFTDSTSGWTLVPYSATAPAGAAFAAVTIKVRAVTNTEAHYADTISFQGGAGNTLWYPGGQGGLLQPMTKVRVSAWWNQLTANQSDITSSTAGWNALSGCTIARSTAHTHFSTGSLLLTSTGSGQMVAGTDSAASGRPIAGNTTYTASCVFLTAATNRNCFVGIRWWDAGGSFIHEDDGNTVADFVGAFALASVTAVSPANAAYADVVIKVNSTVLSEQHYAADFSLNPGPDPVWFPGGPYRMFTGYMESIEHVWPDAGNAEVTITATDGFKVFNLTQLAGTAYGDAVLADSPSAYYRCAENTNTGTSSAGDGSVHVTTLDSSGNSRNGIWFGTATFGVVGPLVAEVDNAVDAGVRTAYSLLPSAASPSSTGAFTIEAWVKPRSFGPPGTSGTIDKIWAMQATASQIVQVAMWNDGKVNFAVNDGTNGGTLDSTAAALTLNKWNHVVCVKTGATPASWKIYVNGVDVSGTSSTSGTGAPNLTGYTTMIAGKDSGGGADVAAFDGLVDEFAIYLGTALSAARVTAHYNAAFGLAANALGGSRIGSLLDLIGWPAGDRTLDAGQFQLQAVTQALYNTSSLAYFLQAVESEGYPAAFFMDGSGNAVYQDRAHSTPSTVTTFGDNNGEVHYELDQTVPARDDLDIWSTVVCQAANGVAKTAADSTSQARYVKRTLSKTNLLNASDADVATLAAALLARFKTPADRIKSVLLHPVTADASTIFPVCLAAEINNRYTFNRHHMLGGGTPFTLDSRCEGVEHDMDFERGDWNTRLAMIPT